MKIPHKSKQNEGWLYWDFAADQQRYFNYIEIFVKNEAVSLISEIIYQGYWRNIHAFETIEIPEDEDQYPFNSILVDIRKELYLVGHFELFGFERQLKVEIPPLPIVAIYLPSVNLFDFKYDEIFGVPYVDKLRYRLKKVNVTDAYYELVSKVSIKVE